MPIGISPERDSAFFLLGTVGFVYPDCCKLENMIEERKLLKWRMLTANRLLLMKMHK